MERANGAMVLGKPYMEVNSTKGIDQKTGKPFEYEPAKDTRPMAASATSIRMRRRNRLVRHRGAGITIGRVRTARILSCYIPALSNCATITIDREKHTKERGWNGGNVNAPERREAILRLLIH
jgi:hypothetical protein